MGFANAGVTINNGVRYFTDTSVPKTITTTPTLFPFPAAYSVFAGDCSSNAAPTGVTPDALPILPGKLDHTVTVQVPALNVVTQLNGANKAGMYVLIKSTTAGCTPKTYLATDLERQLPLSTIPGSPSAPTPSASTTASRPPLRRRARSRRRSRSTR